LLRKPAIHRADKTFGWFTSKDYDDFRAILKSRLSLLRDGTAPNNIPLPSSHSEWMKFLRSEDAFVDQIDSVAHDDDSMTPSMSTQPDEEREQLLVDVGSASDVEEFQLLDDGESDQSSEDSEVVMFE
jgi:hypothetical protein